MTQPLRKPATLEDLYAMPDGARSYELLDGEIVERAAPTGEHGIFQAKLVGAVGNPFMRAPGRGGPGGWWIALEVDVLLPSGELVRPDVSGWRRDKHPEMPRGFPVTAVPDWICEVVSPNRARDDTVRKLRKYERDHVAHYWIIDSRDETLTVLRWTPDGYLVALRAERGERVRAEPFDAIEIVVGELFGDDPELTSPRRHPPSVRQQSLHSRPWRVCERGATGGPMTRRGNAEQRCKSCRMLDPHCVCALMPKLDLRTRVVLILHRYEARKPTNTGQLAAACLVNSEVVVRGHEGQPSEPLVWDDTVQPVLLFPHEDAVPLADIAARGKPIVLVVPDGTWRQARRVRARVPGLTDLPCVTIPVGAPTQYHLRAERRENGLATIEAIARALEVTEGPAVRVALEAIFDEVVARTLSTRGTAPPGPGGP